MPAALDNLILPLDQRPRSGPVRGPKNPLTNGPAVLPPGAAAHISPLNLMRWIEENRHEMKPPVSNKTIWKNQDLIVFVSQGPNTRNDSHVNPTEEFFYQLQGDVSVKIWDAPIGSPPRDVIIREGEVYLIPAWVPHSPMRPPNTLGLIVECVRPEGQKDALRWFCQKCFHIVYEAPFTLTDIDKNLRDIMTRFWGDDATIRTCKHCGEVITKAGEAKLPAS